MRWPLWHGRLHYPTPRTAPALSWRRRSALGLDRLLAIRALVQGIVCKQAHRLFGITARTLRNWIRRFNTRGIDGLIERSRSGRPRKIIPR